MDGNDFRRRIWRTVGYVERILSMIERKLDARRTECEENGDAVGLMELCELDVRRAVVPSSQDGCSIWVDSDATGRMARWLRQECREILRSFRRMERDLLRRKDLVEEIEAFVHDPNPEDGSAVDMERLMFLMRFRTFLLYASDETRR